MIVYRGGGGGGEGGRSVVDSIVLHNHTMGVDRWVEEREEEHVCSFFMCYVWNE